MVRWADLRPDPGLLGALDRAGTRPGRSASQNEKRNWSKAFADQTAVMFANALRGRKVFQKGQAIFPMADGSKSEFVTGSGGRSRGKRVDVSVSTLSAGLQLALSLKGGNFADPGDGTYGKNLTGRLYELLDECRAVHEYHPHAPIVCVYFFPLASCEDRRKKSSFAKAVSAIRAHTGREDPLQVTQFARFDWSVVALYVPDSSDERFSRGVCRYFDVSTAPPLVGRPKVESTLNLSDFVTNAIDLYKGTRETAITYVDPEPD